jgi:hypothetical protein
MVHGAGKVLVEDERHAGCIAKTAIGKADAIGFDELRRRGLVIVLGHLDSLLQWFKPTYEAVGKLSRS